MKGKYEKGISTFFAVAFAVVIFAAGSTTAFADYGGASTPVSNSNPGAIAALPQPGIATAVHPAADALAVSAAVTVNGKTIVPAIGSFVQALKNTAGVQARGNGISLPSAYNGKTLFVFIYSDPKFAGSAVVENGNISLDLAKFQGQHEVGIYDEYGEIIAKTEVNLGGEAKIAKTGSVELPFAVFAFAGLLISSSIALRKFAK